MKRSVAKVVAVALLLLLPIIAFAGKNDLNSGEVAAVKLMVLQKQGVAQLITNEPVVILYFEHEVWKRFDQKEKHNLGKIMLDYTKQLAKEDRKKYDTAMIVEKATKKDILAIIFIEENLIKIKK